MLPVTALILALGLFGHAGAAGPTQAISKEAAKPVSAYASVDGAKVHYQSIGSGSEAVVFIHGWSCNVNFWRDQWPAVAPRKRVVLIDLPGHGISDKPEVAYTQDLFARAVDAVLEHAGITRAVLVGHSMGTPVIRQVYRKYPAKVAALVIVDGSLRPPENPEAMAQFIEPLRGPDYEEAAGRFVEMMLGENTTPELRREIKESMVRTPQRVALSAMDSMADPELWKSDKINVPVLAVLAKSPFWPADTEQFYRSLAPDLEFHMMEGVSHFLMMEKPAEFNRIVIDFLGKRGLIGK